MKVIATNDAPIPQKGYYHRGVYINRAYYRGDIFEVYDRPIHLNDYLIIYHHILEMNIDVDPNSFITLEEYRNQQLEILGI